LALTGAAVVPEPTDCTAVELNVDNELLVPHSNQAVVDEPLAFTVPFSDAEPAVTSSAASVVGVGRLGTVVKDQTLE
jgi:hypothetical protein